MHGRSSNGCTAFMNVACFHRSPAMRIWAELWSSQDCRNVSDGIFSPLGAMFGEYTAWPADMLLLVQSMLNICMGSIFRRFFVAFSGWPWQLCRLVDPMASNEMRRRVAGRFSDAKSCC